ncbi:MAG TPA: hypothetical protein VHA82_15815 [Ramlibacter sp.]|uniref:hypothetical protein n=1 Tax=Ramlibacter sp. TaxID=1917967 RepID=UPI002C9DEDE0|nr:hypothetical protein [Ramlibacter sp.]HVZ45277.1 hypothetical protein [Ramlibacter sp.]
MSGGAAAATRDVSRFLVLERGLQQAMASGDAASVRERVANDFELRVPASAQTTDREHWLRSSLRRASGVVRDLSVREEGGLSIVSFLLVGARQRTRFVVDVWKGEALVARYESPAVAPKGPSRPSGRE